jgi:hypothetical protein
VREGTCVLFGKRGKGHVPVATIPKLLASDSTDWSGNHWRSCCSDYDIWYPSSSSKCGSRGSKSLDTAVDRKASISKGSTRKAVIDASQYADKYFSKLTEYGGASTKTLSSKEDERNAALAARARRGDYDDGKTFKFKTTQKGC